MPDFLTAQQVADILKVSRGFVYEHKSQFGYLDIGGRLRFDRRNLDRYLADHTHQPRCRPGRPRRPQRRIVRRISWDGAQ